jgi:hypothetical protein
MTSTAPQAWGDITMASFASRTIHCAIGVDSSLQISLQQLFDRFLRMIGAKLVPTTFSARVSADRRASITCSFFDGQRMDRGRSFWKRLSHVPSIFVPKFVFQVFSARFP